jgi:chromosome segregation ATPase
LVDRHRRATSEVASLRAQLGERDVLIRDHQREIEELNARRAETGKRLDQLIEELDRLDAELTRSKEGAA